ncbi:hypothetical protein LCGC14_1900410, partial [marine sediment metagenome]
MPSHFFSFQFNQLSSHAITIFKYQFTRVTVG